MPTYPCLTRVKLRNYRSYAECDVELGQFTVVVGQNGAGKSNFVDAIRFISEASERSLADALHERGGIHAILHRATESPIVDICLDLLLRPQSSVVHLESDFWLGRDLSYELTLHEMEDGRVVVDRECLKLRIDDGPIWIGYRVENGTPRWIGGHVNVANDAMLIEPFKYTPCPPARKNDLYLRTASAFQGFSIAAASIQGMRTYSPNLNEMLGPTPNGSEHSLSLDARNIASVLHGFSENTPDLFERIGDYLCAAVPNLDGIEIVPYDQFADVHFRFPDGRGGEASLSSWYASEGTLRLLAALVAALQPREEVTPSEDTCLTIIEEPEKAVHPGAAAVLMDAFHEATLKRQILITTHSPDLLDRLESDDKLLVVEWENGTSRIAEPDYAGRESIRKGLYTPGELLRLNQLTPARRNGHTSVSAASLAQEPQKP